jgi:acyl-CoA reductase-like NAD-dependent aldehyde dehydrogenase
MTTSDGARLFIGGQFRAAEQTVVVVEAATEAPLGYGASATAADVDAAVGAARSALSGWRSTSAEARALILGAFAGALRSRAESTSELVSRESGLPISVSQVASGVLPAVLLDYYANLAGQTPAEEVRPAALGHTIVRHEPVGVVAAIPPWNYPHALAAFKVAPALAAGCTVVLKAAPETALDAMVFGETAIQAGLPPGVLNVIAGGAKAGAHLVAHPGVDRVAFTGSTETGRAIGETCGRLLRPVTLELGGKSAAIVLDDADLDATMQGLRTASFANAGQICHQNSRILAPQSRYREVVDAVAALAENLRVGDPLDPATETGPLVSARQRKRVLDYIDIGKAGGARLVTGGGVPKDQPRGWFVSPTVFADVDNADRIAREEIFGPVLTVIPYASETEAIDIANDSAFGLAGSVWSTDADRATAVARQVATGTIGVNGYQLDVAAPFGGMKDSGIGRELCPEGLAAYQNLKSIYRPQPAG